MVGVNNFAEGKLDSVEAIDNPAPTRTRGFGGPATAGGMTIGEVANGMDAHRVSDWISVSFFVTAYSLKF